MMALLFIAHTFSVERVIGIETHDSGGVSLLFLLRVPEAKKSSVDEGWMETALADVVLTADGVPAMCDAHVKGTAALWECAPGVHFQLWVGARLATALAFAPHASRFYAANPAPQALQREMRLIEWIVP